jgi:hypothetical protein
MTNAYWLSACGKLFLLSKILLNGVAPGSSDHHGKKEWKKKYSDKFRSSCRDEEKVVSPEQV